MLDLHLPGGALIDIDFDFVDVDDEVLLAEKGGQRLIELAKRLGSALRKEFCGILRVAPHEVPEDCAEPWAWTGDTPYFHARCLLDGKVAVEAAGGTVVTSICQLASDTAVDAVIEFYTRAGVYQQNASRILRGIRPMIRLVGARLSKASSRKIARLSHSPRRDDDLVLPTKQACQRAASEMFREALAMIAGGKERRGQTRLRDAVALAVQIQCSYRRSELAGVDIEMLFHSRARVEVKILVSPKDSKVREIQLGTIRDFPTIKMLERLKAGRQSGPLFTTNWNKRLRGTELYRALGRTGQRSALSFQLNFNRTRRIAIADEDTSEAQQAQLRQVRGSASTRAYQMHDPASGFDEARAITHNYGRASADFSDQPKIGVAFRARRVTRAARHSDLR